MSRPASLTDAVAAMRRGDRAGAAELCRRVLAEQGEQAEVRHLLGVLAHQAGQHEEAAGHLERAIALQAGNAEFHNTLGAVYLAIGRVPGAERVLRRVVKLRPECAEAHHNLGLCLERRELWLSAEEAYRRAAALKPDYASAHLQRGKLLQRRGQLADAEQALRQALAVPPRSAAACNALGVVLSRQQRHAEAAACYRQALEIMPETPSAQANLGMAPMEQGAPAEALSYLERACEQRPQNAVYWNGLMRCQLALQQYVEATDAGRRAVAAGGRWPCRATIRRPICFSASCWDGSASGAWRCGCRCRRFVMCMKRRCCISSGRWRSTLRRKRMRRWGRRTMTCKRMIRHGTALKRRCSAILRWLERATVWEMCCWSWARCGPGRSKIEAGQPRHPKRQRGTNRFLTFASSRSLPHVRFLTFASGYH